MKRPFLTALVGAVALGATVAPAVGASVVNATASQKTAITTAIQTTSVAGLNQVPQANYTVGETVLYAGSKYWARASIVATPAARATFQGSIAVLARSGGTNTWTVLDIGTSGVGCRVAPERRGGRHLVSTTAPVVESEPVPSPTQPRWQTRPRPDGS